MPRAISQLLRTPLVYLASNLISLLGVVMVTSATVLWLITFPIFFKGETSSPYIGIILFFALPSIFFGGLALIPVGIFFHIRKVRRSGQRGPLVPQGNELRRLATFVALTSFLNIVIGSQFVYR